MINETRIPKISQLVDYFITEYESYYGEKFPRTQRDRLYKELLKCYFRWTYPSGVPLTVSGFKSHILRNIFKKYDDLGYSTCNYPKFCIGHLHVSWLMENLVKHATYNLKTNKFEFSEEEKKKNIRYIKKIKEDYKIWFM